MKNILIILLFIGFSEFTLNWINGSDGDNVNYPTRESSDTIVVHFEYGEDFSWADKRWQYKADTSDKPGGPTQHIAEAHNHHLTHVVNKD